MFKTVTDGRDHTGLVSSKFPTNSSELSGIIRHLGGMLITYLLAMRKYSDKSSFKVLFWLEIPGYNSRW